MVLRCADLLVAPFAGAWIEIRKVGVHIPTTEVAPFAGAWIEIVKGIQCTQTEQSRSLRGSVD